MSKIIATAKARNNGELYTTMGSVHQHSLIADELPVYGGKDRGPAPGDYICMALASCTVMTLRMYVERKKWKVDEISVNVNMIKSDDAAAGNSFHVETAFTGDLNDEQRKRLKEIAAACPIHRILSKPSEVIMS